MKKILLQEKGAALLMVLMVMVVLFILGGALVRISLTENRFAIKNEEKLQAHYIARAAAQSVAERLIKGDDISFIFGEEATSDFAGGNAKITVSEPSLGLDGNEVILIESIGFYKGTNQTVKIEVERTPEGIGIFSNTFYAFENISGGLNQATVSGKIEAGGSISVNKIPNGIEVNSPVIYPSLSLTIPSFDNTNTINIFSSLTINSPRTLKVNNFSLGSNNKKDDNLIQIKGNGVTNLFLYNNADIKGDISIADDAQLHIYVIGDHTVTIQGSSVMKGKLFIYAPNGRVNFQSTTTTDLKGIIIAKNLDLANHISFAHDQDVYEAISNENWIETSNIGVSYTGYTWISND